MILVEKILGNTAEPFWADSLSEYELDKLCLEQWEAPKSRLRKKSVKGYEVAISLPRDVQLKNKDIIYLDKDNKVAVITQIALKDVMVIHLEQSEKHADWHELCFRLGHALGNQHWPAVFKNNLIYVPFYVDQKIMTSVIRTHGFDQLQLEFLSGEQVAPLLEPSEMRLLFSSAEMSPHQHQVRDSN